MEQFTPWAADTLDAGWSLMTTNPSLLIAVFSVGILIGALVVWILMRGRIRAHQHAARYYKGLWNRASTQQLNETVTQSETDPVSKQLETGKAQHPPETTVGIRPTTEVFRGQPLSPEDLERIRLELESFDSIKVVDEELRGLVRRNWPHLLAKLPPEKE